VYQTRENKRKQYTTAPTANWPGMWAVVSRLPGKI
jgi:hypothetical protein